MFAHLQFYTSSAYTDLCVRLDSYTDTRVFHTDKKAESGEKARAYRVARRRRSAEKAMHTAAELTCMHVGSMLDNEDSTRMQSINVGKAPLVTRTTDAELLIHHQQHRPMKTPVNTERYGSFHVYGHVHRPLSVSLHSTRESGRGRLQLIRLGPDICRQARACVRMYMYMYVEREIDV